MKLKQLAGVCKQNKTELLMDTETTQWVSNGHSTYLLPENLPEITESTICTILDIPTEKAANYLIRRQEMPASYNTADTDDTEEDLNWDPDNRVMYLGKDLLPLKATDGKVFFIPFKALKPVEDSKAVSLSLRYSANDHPYIAAKDGLFLTAIIMPVRIQEDMITWLRGCHNGAVRLKSWEEDDDE